jgi:hypothetical protein
MRDETLEDFQWLAYEIAGEGGEATICGAAFLAGTTDEELQAAFVAARDADYREIAVAAHGLEPGDEAAITRLSRRFTAAQAQDWFDAPGRDAAEGALRAAEERLREPAAAPRAPDEATGSAPRGLTWVTRAGVFVDRIASAWLIRRFIDPDARFAFVTTTRYDPRPGELRFDMFEAEYTHEGDRCTFEVLMDRFAPGDPALQAIAEIVHDIDLKDERFGRAETAGIAAVLQGIAAGTTDDAVRLERGAALLDSLYATLGSPR